MLSNIVLKSNIRPVLALKMLGLYLYTLKTGLKSCNMLGILIKLTLQRELHNFVINDLFLDK